MLEKGSNLGDKLLYHRKLNNLTQDQLANILGVNNTTIKDIEKNNRLPGREISEQLASYFKLETKYFYDQYLEDTDNADIKLKEYRNNNNLTIREAAKKLNIGYSTWSMWEAKLNYISREKYSYLKELGFFKS